MEVRREENQHLSEEDRAPWRLQLGYGHGDEDDTFSSSC